MFSGFEIDKTLQKAYLSSSTSLDPFSLQPTSKTLSCFQQETQTVAFFNNVNARYVWLWKRQRQSLGIHGQNTFKSSRFCSKARGFVTKNREQKTSRLIEIPDKFALKRTRFEIKVIFP